MYDYQKEKAWLFTEAGQVAFMKMRDGVDELLLVAGAFTFDRAYKSGSEWCARACLDRLVELGELGVMSTGMWTVDTVYVPGPERRR